MAQHNRNNWHHIPGIGGIMATGLSIKGHLQNRIVFNSLPFKLITQRKSFA